MSIEGNNESNAVIYNGGTAWNPRNIEVQKKDGEEDDLSERSRKSDIDNESDWPLRIIDILLDKQDLVFPAR